VVRNTIRRRLRHLVRDELAMVASGTDIVVRVLPEAAGRSYQELGLHLHAAIEAATRARTGREGRSGG
jgi:ribonuclease P protein component